MAWARLTVEGGQPSDGRRGRGSTAGGAGHGRATGQPTGAGGRAMGSRLVPRRLQGQSGGRASCVEAAQGMWISWFGLGEMYLV